MSTQRSVKPRTTHTTRQMILQTNISPPGNEEESSPNENITGSTCNEKVLENITQEPNQIEKKEEQNVIKEKSYKAKTMDLQKIIDECIKKKHVFVPISSIKKM